MSNIIEHPRAVEIARKMEWEAERASRGSTREGRACRAPEMAQGNQARARRGKSSAAAA
jgi:hypothetical protein